MKLRGILTAFVVMACGSLCAQNVTKADLVKLESQLNSLSQKVTQLESNLERVITENVNLVEQLNIQTVTSVMDKNGIQWDIVNVVPNESESKVYVTIRVTNKSGVNRNVYAQFVSSDNYAIDTNSNLNNNSYKLNGIFDKMCDNGIPVNYEFEIVGVPTSCAYLGIIKFFYNETAFSSSRTKASVEFTGVHIPW